MGSTLCPQVVELLAVMEAEDGVVGDEVPHPFKANHVAATVSENRMRGECNCRSSLLLWYSGGAGISSRWVAKPRA